MTAAKLEHRTRAPRADAAGLVLYEPESALSERADALVRLAALLALGARADVLAAMVTRARHAGASEREITDVLVTIAPVIGQARVVGAACELLQALGHEPDAG